jgi:hypothetical protein
MTGFPDITQFISPGWFLVLQIGGGLLSLVLIAIIFYTIRDAGYPQRHVRHLWTAWKRSPLPKHKMTIRWLAIESASKGNDPGAWRDAIVDADMMLDQVLLKLGYNGESMEERLNNAPPDHFASLQDAPRAHQIREFIEDDPTYMPTKEVFDRTIEIYKNIFEEMGILI